MKGDRAKLGPNHQLKDQCTVCLSCVAITRKEFERTDENGFWQEFIILDPSITTSSTLANPEDRFSMDVYGNIGTNTGFGYNKYTSNCYWNSN